MHFSFSNRANNLVGQEMFSILDRAKELEKNHVPICHLELGDSKIPPAPEIIQSAIFALQEGDVGYSSSYGLIELREKIAKYYNERRGTSLRAENIVISSANFLVSQFLELSCNHGDAIVVFSPAFPTYLAASSYMGLKLLSVPLDQDSGFQLARGDVDKAVQAKPKAIIVNSANNPTGAIYPREIMEYLLHECEKHGIWLLSDETYGDLCFGSPFHSLVGYGYPQLVIISSFSKVLSIPGFRIGYAIAHKQVVDKIALSNSTLVSCFPIFTQIGCLAGLNIMDKYTEKTRAYFQKVCEEFHGVIQNSGVLRCFLPKAAFYLCIDITKTHVDDMTFVRLLLENKNTAVTPGRSFGDAHANLIRIAVCGDYKSVQAGVDNIIALANQMALM